MALEHLLRALERDADAEVEALLAGARAEAATIAAAATAQAERSGEEALAALSRERRESLEAELAAASRDARRGVLEARQRFLDRVFAGALAALELAQQDAAYVRSLPALLDESLACTGLDTGTVVTAPPALQDALSSLVKGRGVRLDISNDVPPGFTVTARNGALTVDNTLAGRLARARAALALEIVAAARA